MISQFLIFFYFQKNEVAFSKLAVKGSSDDNSISNIEKLNINSDKIPPEKRAGMTTGFLYYFRNFID